MRKNSPRKWLHACLDLLPVILIPVFMIYSHRHTIDSGSIQVPQNEVVDFNQLVKNGNFEDLSNMDFIRNTYDYSVSDNELTLTRNSETYVDTYLYTQFIYENTFVENHKYFVHLDVYLNTQSSSNFSFRIYPAYVNIGTFSVVNSQWTLFEDIYTSTFSLDNYVNCFMQLLGSDVLQVGDYIILRNFEIIDLSKMFGVGNEPTIAQFNQWYTQDYYDYTLSHKELLKNTSTISYSDTDIMSQFTYQLYNSVDKYFNMGNVFNMTSVYDWFNLNIFGGNAPISIYIVWNIVLYEFVMDLLFLLYGLFMWFIDMVQHLMDKPFKSIK